MTRGMAIGCAMLLLAAGASAQAQNESATSDGAATTQSNATPSAYPETDLKALRDDIAALRSDLKAITAQVKAVRTLQDRVDALESRLDTLESAGSTLKTKIDALVKSNAALLEQVQGMSSKGGLDLLGNLNDDPQLRSQVVQATNPQAAVVLYNHMGRTTRLNVNGTWYNLAPGRRTISVPYGPVAITHCDKQNPRTFTEWTPADGGYVMVFDVETSTAQ